MATSWRTSRSSRSAWTPWTSARGGWQDGQTIATFTSIDGLFEGNLVWQAGAGVGVSVAYAGTEDVAAVDLTFEEPFDGPAPLETTVTLPFVLEADKWVTRTRNPVPAGARRALGGGLRWSPRRGGITPPPPCAVRRGMLACVTLRTADGALHTLGHGDIVGRLWTAASQARTIAQGAVQATLRIELHWDTAHLHREGHPSLTLTGHPARLLTELAAVGTAAAWADLARALWRDESERDRLRRRFDTVLGRLRRQLRGSGIRPDLVKPDGAGNFSLVLLPQDRVDDRS